MYTAAAAKCVSILSPEYRGPAMTIKQSKSPDALTFGPRRPSFELAQALAGDWHGGSAFKTAYFNAMSILFPLGEKFLSTAFVVTGTRSTTRSCWMR